MTTVKYYQNKRNPNKIIEVHNDGHRHNTVRQFMYYEYRKNGILLSITKNMNGDGRLHRWRKSNLNQLLEDYTLSHRMY